MDKLLETANRLLLEVELKPVQGDRFQSTGFASLGPAIYERPDGTRMLLVESAQSMANRLEKVCLDGDGPYIRPELKGLPYIVSKLSGASSVVTSSLVEAHRINSPFILTADADFQDKVRKGCNYDPKGVLDWKSIAKTIFRFDTNSLVHGVFLSNLEGGRVRLPRAVTSFIEAEDVREVASGGVKNSFDPTGTIVVNKATEDKDVYSNVPYHRLEFVAGKIRCFFNVDLALLRGYGLGESATDLLTSLCLLKIRLLLDGGLRLRTACDLMPVGEFVVTQPLGFGLPKTAELIEEVSKGIAACRQAGLFSEAVDGVTVLSPLTKTKASKKKGPTGSDEAKDDGEGAEAEE